MITIKLRLILILLSNLNLLEALIIPRSNQQLRVVYTNSTSLPLSKVNLIKQVLKNNANESWEIGTHMQALTEYDYPTLSPFFASYSPPPLNPFATSVITLVTSLLSTKNTSLLPLIPDGSVGDPASIGAAVTLGNWTIGSSNQIGNVSATVCGSAAKAQVQFLLGVAPRTSDGAISHRSDQVQLWSDFVYMVPPFLSYYGVMTHNVSVIQASYDQCRLYRQYLRRSTGLWAHIILGTNPDPGLWATGNAWAAAGMLRTYATIIHSSYARLFTAQTDDLANWVIEIVEAAFALQPKNGYLFPNYFNETSSFSDASSTALLTAVSYRLAQLSLSNSTLSKAELSRQAIYAAVNPTTGILLPVVNPLAYPFQGTMSPEGEAFVLLMEASWRDWVGGGGIVSTGNSAGTGTSSSSGSSTSSLPKVGGSTTTSSSASVIRRSLGMMLGIIGGVLFLF